MLKPKNEFFFWSAIIFILAINLIIFNVLIITADTTLSVQYIPDDGYYYLSLARNFAGSGIWSFDSGVSKTSGFHPLFAYILATGFFLNTFNTDSFVIFGILLGLIFTLGAVAFTWYWAWKNHNILLLIFLAIMISSPNFIYNTVSITEWGLSLLISSTYCLYFFEQYEKKQNWLIFFFFFTIGFLGSVCRADFGLLPFVIFISTIVARRKKTLLFAGIGFLGALLGLIAVFGHSYLITGEFLQSSAKMKSYWGQLGSPNYYIGAMILSNIVGFGGLILLSSLLATQVFNQQKTIIKRFQNTEKNIIAILGAGLSILGYALVYAQSADHQPWYSVNFIPAIFLLTYGLSSYIYEAKTDKIKSLTTLFVILIVSANIVSIYPINTHKAPWPHQKFMYQAGEYLRKYPLPERIGAWNAGIINYYQGGSVINIDGLVNNDIYEYAIQNNLKEYIINHSIRYIIDFESMLTDTDYRIRGGYDEIFFLENLYPEIVFDNGEYSAWQYLSLYSVKYEEKSVP